MGRVTIELDDALAQILGALGQPLEQAARELIVVELYRREMISSGRAAELLGMPKLTFIQRVGLLGIPYFRLTDAELAAEVSRLPSQ